tara:strand:- start:513 stop:1190 length:678 start_codon:yes stop_codon:yes gene_type:complete
MGFLNNTTITIDAILTKRGRELLARGRNEFKVTKFALADDEVDYRLWDTSHPNGTNYYGAVIENMPLLEPVPDETQVLKYKLVTLPKETSRLPILDVSISSLNFTSGVASAEIIAPGTLNSTDSEQGYTFIIHDTAVAKLEVNQAAPSPSAPLIPVTMSEDELTQSQNTTGLSAKVLPQVFTTPQQKSTQITIVGNQTGATTTLTVTVNKTELGSPGSSAGAPSL